MTISPKSVDAEKMPKGFKIPCIICSNPSFNVKNPKKNMMGFNFTYLNDGKI